MNAILEWPIPQSIKQVQSFLELTNFYRRFIHKYADIARPISEIVRHHKYGWNESQQDAFNQLKAASAPVLSHPRADAQL